ncbi:tetratricopeptide repeat protein [Yoonia sp. 2307UL14-13]|uniref:tetratricopeptide repeat protein n=1 Tax=Yoonia sp. 2307UL14-13 TaxID=3126506 RepID=UPI0030B4AB56
MGVLLSKLKATLAVGMTLNPLVVLAQEERIALEFRPPDLAPSAICIPRESDEDTVAFWSGWDGGALPDISIPLIKRDISRLQNIDGRAWFDTIDALITRIAEADPSFAGNNALLARIGAMEAAGDFEGIAAQQLVAQLAAEADELSPRLKNALSRFYREGIGVPRDAERANQLLLEAGHSGNADALLTLSKMALDGNAPQGWDVPTDLAVTMAFGALVGELNPTICDRTARIAREFHNGDVVARNVQLAHDWFRFTADLGDANAAWKVVEYHMEAEGFEKNNAVLVEYLQQASDAGLPFAQIALGRLYETGSLVERDLDRTLALYRDAASVGGRPGLTRLTLFLETHANTYPDLDDERFEALKALAALDDAPAWAFTRLAQDTLDREGRWAGEFEAIALLEKAVDLGDMDAMSKLAQILISQRDDPENFERAVDLLSHTVSAFGGVTPTKHLHAAFMCQAIDSPRLAEATHWRAIEASTDSANIEISANQLIALNAEDDPLTVATIQSQALYGRPKSLASYLKFLEFYDRATPEMRAFWEEYSGQYSQVLQALAKLELELAQSPLERLAAIDLLRKEYRNSGTPAALALAEALLSYDSTIEESSDEVRRLLNEPAQAGEGAAIRLIASLDINDPTGRDTFEQFADIIDANGDFDALVFAIPFLEPDARSAYLSRAVGVMPCDYKNVMTMSDLALALGDKDEALRWMDIAKHLVDRNAWAMTDLARSHLNVASPDAAFIAQTYFEDAYALGDPSAARGLFELLVAVDAPTYKPEEAAAMLASATDNPDRTVLEGYLGRYRRADPVAQAAIDQFIDMPEIYRVAAENGDVFAMRAYAVHLRDNASVAADLVDATTWMNRAAEGGDTTAMAEFGYALAFGIGTEPDPDAALIWLERAAENGSEKARAITSLINLGDGS